MRLAVIREWRYCMSVGTGQTNLKFVEFESETISEYNPLAVYNTIYGDWMRFRRCGVLRSLANKVVHTEAQ